MMKHISEEQLALHAGGDLLREETEAVEKHLQTCAECRALLGQFQYSAAMLQVGFGKPAADDLQTVRDSVVQRLRKRKEAATHWAWAAGAAAAAIVAAVVLSHGKQPPRTTVTSRQMTTAYLQIQYRPLVELSMPNLAGNLEHVRTRQHPLRPGLRNVTLLAERDGPPILKMTTSDPEVVILWQLKEGHDAHD